MRNAMVIGAAFLATAGAASAGGVATRASGHGQVAYPQDGGGLGREAGGASRFRSAGDGHFNGAAGGWGFAHHDSGHDGRWSGGRDRAGEGRGRGFEGGYRHDGFAYGHGGFAHDGGDERRGWRGGYGHRYGYRREGGYGGYGRALGYGLLAGAAAAPYAQAGYGGGYGYGEGSGYGGEEAMNAAPYGGPDPFGPQQPYGESGEGGFAGTPGEGYAPHLAMRRYVPDDGDTAYAYGYNGFAETPPVPQAMPAYGYGHAPMYGPSGFPACGC